MKKPYLNKEDKQRLKQYLLDCLGDLRKIKNIMHVDNLDLSISKLQEFIDSNKNYYKSTYDRLEQLKIQEAEDKLFKLVQAGNMKAVEIFLKRVDEKSKVSDDKNINIKLTLPDDIEDK